MVEWILPAKAVFARHGAAIRDGAMAMAITAVEFMIETVGRRLRQPPRADAHHLYGPRAHCQAITANCVAIQRSTSGHRSAMPTATAVNATFQQEQHDAVEQAWRQRHGLMRTVGAEIAAEWMQRRSAGHRWLAALAEM
ncbi:hypothetical protein [Mycolicibacterium porcinum]